MRLAAVFTIPLLFSTAAAAPKLGGYVTALGDESNDMADETPPKLAFTGTDQYVGAKKFKDVRPSTQELGWWSEKVVIAEAADKKSAWIAADVGEEEIACGAAPCPPEPPKVATYHATILLDQAGKGYNYLAWNLAAPVSGKEQAAAMKRGTVPEALPREIGAGAEDVVKFFETSIADAKTLSASVSARKDVVLYGSELPERTVGGDKVKVKLAAWKLGFKVRDGIVAGVTASKTVAWVAANLVARKKPSDKGTPYRVLFLYEKTGTAWQLVQANFAFVP